MTWVGEGVSHLPFAEITWACVCKVRAISQNVEELLPLREQDTECLPRKEEDGVVGGTEEDAWYSIQTLR